MLLKVNEQFNIPVERQDAFEIDSLIKEGVFEDGEDLVVGFTLFVHDIHGGRCWLYDCSTKEECRALAKTTNPNIPIWEN